MGVNNWITYPVFFLGTLGVAIVIWFIRARNGEGSIKPGVILSPSPLASSATIQNEAKEITMLVGDTFTPRGSSSYF